VSCPRRWPSSRDGSARASRFDTCSSDAFAREVAILAVVSDSRTLDATPRRLARARQRLGRPTSPELTAAVALGIAVLVLPSLAATLVAAFSQAWSRALAAARSPGLPTGGVSGLAQLGATSQLAAFLQLCAAVLVAVALSTAAVTWLQRGVFVRFAAAAGGDRELGSVPRERLAERVARASFACAKWSLLMVALVAPWSDALRGMSGAWQRAPSELLPIAGGLVESLFERAAIVLAALGVIDFGVQQALFRRRLKMSRQQLQEEQRATEADPHATAERRRRAREQQAASVLQELGEVAYVVCDLEGRAFALRERDAELAVWIAAEGDLAFRVRSEAIARGLRVAVDAELALELGKFEIGETLPPTIAARLQLPRRT